MIGYVSTCSKQVYIHQFNPVELANLNGPHYVELIVTAWQNAFNQLFLEVE